MARFILILLSTVPFLSAAAPPGKDLYALYCIACHGPDGKGAPGAAFPPLARSDWVNGDPDRMIAVVLHGLNGPIAVSKKPYNLLMPPQGAVLNDEQIASISTYVRTNFGNKQKPVTPEQVAKVREKHKDRTTPWTGPDILQHYPLPLSRWRIHDLTATVYEGSWDSLPDFDKLTPVSEEKENAPISLAHAGDRKDKFLIVWEGRVETPGTFDNNFWLSSKGEARLFLNGQLVSHLKGQSTEFRNTSARTGAKQGWNHLRLEYLQNGPGAGVMLARSGGPMGEHFLTDAVRDVTAKTYPDIFIGPENGKAALYRNTIEGVSPRAIAVGLPGGINYAFSAQTLAVETIWTGKFINAGQHWTVRGTGATKPAGENIITLAKGPSIAQLNKLSDPWPDKLQDELNPRFKGYDLNDANSPTFRFELANIRIEDTFAPPQGNEVSRFINFIAPDNTNIDSLYLRLAHDHDISNLGHGKFQLGDELQIDVHGAMTAIVHDRSLILPLKSALANGNTVFLTYTWLKK